MATITITIDVQNPVEVVKHKKGSFTGMLAGLFMNDKKLKNEVESKICHAIIQQLKDKVGDGLKNEGVNARVSYAIVIDEDVEIV